MNVVPSSFHLPQLLLIVREVSCKCHCFVTELLFTHYTDCSKSSALVFYIYFVLITLLLCDYRFIGVKQNCNNHHWCCSCYLSRYTCPSNNNSDIHFIFWIWSIQCGCDSFCDFYLYVCVWLHNVYYIFIYKHFQTGCL